MKNVAISVIMPSLNVVQYIEKCLDSVTNQSLKNIEIICVDAKSTDGTLEILEQYRDKDDRIRLLVSNYKSYGAQVNLGIDVSCGKYIAILETDDYIDYGMYEALFNAAEKNDCDFVKCNYYTFWTQKDGIPFSQKRHILWDQTLYDRIICDPNPKDVCINDLYLWNGIYKKSFLKVNKIRFSETEGASFQDVSFLFQTSIKCKKIMFVEKALYYYCIDREDSSSNSDKGFLYSFREYNFVYAIHKDTIISNRSVAKAFYCRLALALYNSVNDAMQVYGRNSRPYYDWFCNEIKWALDKDIISDEDTNFNVSLQSLIVSYEEYVERQQVRRNTIISTLGDTNQYGVVIFGSGNFGIHAYRWLSRMGYKIVGFIDNDNSKWTQIIDGVSIRSPESLNPSDASVRYIISNNMHAKEMYTQLIDIGIKEDYICVF